MKLKDLQERLRSAEHVEPAELRRLPVDELDDLLIAKGTILPPEELMARIERSTIKGRAFDTLIIDDPLKDAPPGRVDTTKPDNVETMLRRGGVWTRDGGKDGLPRFEGSLVYSPREDDLCQAKGIETPGSAIVTVWFGERTERGNEVLKGVAANRLYVVPMMPCKSCRGVTFDHVGWVPCRMCNGLRMQPTAAGLKPWAEEKRRDLDRVRR